jgi:hypothetical protein
MTRFTAPARLWRVRALAVILGAIVATAVAMVAVEAWVRWQWDPTRGTPGFYLSDPLLGQRLAPGYRGWFAGTPVRINSLGFRDERDYSLEKAPNTFRILILGDSVTFGHGALSETTYPFLLEQQLRQWRPDVDWQVWNLGVPGYNTSQELAYLQQVGPSYRPDLVVVGFFENDLAGNKPPSPPTRTRRVLSAVQRSMQRRLYSFELYKKVALTAQWRLLSPDDRSRIEAMAAEEALLAEPGDLAGHPSRRLTEVDRFDDVYVCPEVDTNPNRDRLGAHLAKNSDEIAAWREAVKALQQLHSTGAYRIAFFINMAPNVCPGHDRFFDGGAIEDEQALRAILGQGTPVGGSVRAFLPYRPSQMPGAQGHSAGNANRVKAAALFDFLRGAGLLAVEP